MYPVFSFWVSSGCEERMCVVRCARAVRLCANRPCLGTRSGMDVRHEGLYDYTHKPGYEPRPTSSLSLSIHTSCDMQRRRTSAFTAASQRMEVMSMNRVRD